MQLENNNFVPSALQNRPRNIQCAAGANIPITPQIEAVDPDGSLFAGEIGHIQCSDPSGFSAVCCACGKTGCLENYLSLRGLKMFAGNRFGRFNATLLKKHPAGFYEFLHPYLIQMGVTAVNLFDPKLVILGGETVEPFLGEADFLLEDIRSQSWMSGPDKLITYKMADCDTALGAALGTVNTAIHTISRNLVCRK